MNNIKYGILTKDKYSDGRVWLEIGFPFDTIGAAEDYIVGLENDGNQLLAILSIDLITGITKTESNTYQIDDLIEAHRRNSLSSEDLEQEEDERGICENHNFIYNTTI